MLVLTKLDLVPVAERARVIKFVKSKLQLWKADIPVFIPYDVQMPDDTYSNIIGLDKIKDCLAAWSRADERVALTEEWIKEKLRELISEENAITLEKNILLSTDENNRSDLIAKKKNLLYSAEGQWEKLKNEMVNRNRESHELLTQR